MVIRLSGYSGPYQICALAKNPTVRDDLLSKGLNALYIEGSTGMIFPSGTTFSLTSQEQGLLAVSQDYDVFELRTGGYAYKYYDNSSLDNAILVTNRCNSNCIMCPTAEVIRRGDEEYCASELIEIIRYIPDDAPHITITGGEPFLIKEDLFAVLNYLKEHLPNTDFLLLTNGRAFCSRKYVERLVESMPPNLILGIPIHGYDSVSHDSITQAMGSFQQTIQGLHHLRALHSNVELRIVISKLNLAFVPNIAQLIASEFPHVQSVKFIAMEMTGNAAKNEDIVWVDYPTAFAAAKPGIDLLIRTGIDVALYNFPLCAVERAYWNICEKSISDYKVRYAPECSTCGYQDACGGIFSGTIRLAKAGIRPIR